MTVKRNELEILNKAIDITEIKMQRVMELGRVEKETPCMCDIKRPVFKKGDTKGVEEYYQEKIKDAVANVRVEMGREKRIAELLIDIEGCSNQLNLLRWLYEESEDNNGR